MEGTPVHSGSAEREGPDGARTPVILAGGLTPENVAAAIAAVRPAGVDANSGLENARGHKDPARVREFVRLARSA